MLLLVLQSILEKSKVKSSVESVHHYGFFSPVSHISHEKTPFSVPTSNQSAVHIHTPSLILICVGLWRMVYVLVAHPVCICST